MESVLRSEAYSSDGSMKENQSDNAQNSSPPQVRGTLISSLKVFYVLVWVMEENGSPTVFSIVEKKI